MKTTHRPVRRALSAIVLATGGLALSAAIWASGSHGFALGALAFYTVASIVVFVWAGGRGDVAAILGTSGDERQRGLDRDATAITGLAVTLFALVGAIVAIARTGNPGAFGVICFVGGASYVVALTVLRRRR
jgi:peptidoglycan/LPS O-acetylase OafA/YrhL